MGTLEWESQLGIPFAEFLLRSESPHLQTSEINIYAHNLEFECTEDENDVIPSSDFPLIRQVEFRIIVLGQNFSCLCCLNHSYTDTSLLY